MPPEPEISFALAGKYRHFCPEWDEMEIDETMPEFGACLCFLKDWDAMRIQERILDEIEAQGTILILDR